jgi:hypothetical protein
MIFGHGRFAFCGDLFLSPDGIITLGIGAGFVIAATFDKVIDCA